MRIAIDATPAAVQHAGVGRYTRELLSALVTLPGVDEFVIASAGNDADNQRLLRQLPPGRRRELRRFPADPRLMTAAWQRVRIPLRVESLVGEFDLFHGPDFVVPPSRKPRVVTVHDLSFLLASEFAEPSLVNYLRSAVPHALDAASVVITVSASVAAEVAEVFPAIREKLVAIPSGVRLPAEQPPRVAASRPELLTVGTIEPRKNLLTLIDAMTLIQARHPDVRLTIAGRIGWRSDDIVVRIRSAKAAGIVRFIDAPDDPTLDRLYAAATAVVLPSFYEGFGLPVLEAMARGVPVVASDISALRETGGDVATYVDPRDPEAIAAGIVALLDDQMARERAANAGIARAMSFNWRETAVRTRRAYDLAMRG